MLPMWEDGRKIKTMHINVHWWHGKNKGGPPGLVHAQKKTK